MHTIDVLSEDPKARGKATVQKALNLHNFATGSRFFADEFYVVVVEAVAVRIIVYELIQFLLLHAFLESLINIHLHFFILPENWFLV